MSGKKPMSRGARQALVEGLIMAVLAVLGLVLRHPEAGDVSAYCGRWHAGVIALIDLLPGPDQEPEDHQTAGGGPPGGRPGETGGAV